jgi:phosphoglycerol transferase MdoB-like AlkP superfamily enzyme
MVRIVVQELLLFLLPIAIYLAYALWRRRRARLAGVAPKGLEQGPWFWLIAGGLVLSIAGFVTLGVANGERPTSYEPARIENGRVVPGTAK